MIRPAGDKIKIEHIREVCRDAAYLPYLSKRKIYFFTELDKLTEVAANAFLKTLEEPPAGVIFLAMAPGEDRVLPTILSRMQRCYVSFAEEGSDPEQVGAEKDDPTVIEGFSGWKSIDLFHLAEYWEKQDRTLIDRHLLNLCEEFRRRMLAEPDNSAYPRIIGEIGEAREHLASNVNTRLLLEDLILEYRSILRHGHPLKACGKNATGIIVRFGFDKIRACVRVRNGKGSLMDKKTEKTNSACSCPCTGENGASCAAGHNSSPNREAPPGAVSCGLSPSGGALQSEDAQETGEAYTVIGVRFKRAGKIYYLIR